MDMKASILEVAQQLVQQRGVNGFSYADIAKEVGVSKPSLHHHFATKSELISRLLENYTKQLVDYLHALDAKDLSAKDKLAGYIDLYRCSLDQDRVCLGGMLSAEALTLAPEIKPQLAQFFAYQQDWLENTLNAGQAAGELTLSMATDHQATVIIATLQGALMVSRAAQSKTYFDQCVAGLMSTFG